MMSPCAGLRNTPTVDRTPLRSTEPDASGIGRILPAMTSIPANRLRVQLQQQSGGKTIHHGSIVLEEDDGVTENEVVAALRRLRALGVIPDREHWGG